jgi:hypothetical protein
MTVIATARPRLSGRKRNASTKVSAVTLPPIKSVEPAERPRLAKARLAASGNPLGIPTVRRPSTPVGQATEERMCHARSAGQRLQRESERTERGEETGLMRRRFISPIEQLAARGSISKAAFDGLSRLQADRDHAEMAGSSVTARYEPDPNYGDSDALHGAERTVAHRQRLVSAMKAVDTSLHPILAWILNEDLPRAEVEKHYWPHLGVRARANRFLGLLELAGSSLSRFYEGPKLRSAKRGSRLSEALTGLDCLLRLA